jgi:hypothetical protein
LTGCKHKIDKKTKDHKQKTHKLGFGIEKQNANQNISFSFSWDPRRDFLKTEHYSLPSPRKRSEQNMDFWRDKIK